MNRENGRSKCPDCDCIFETDADELEDKIKARIKELESQNEKMYEMYSMEYVESSNAFDVNIHLIKELQDLLPNNNKEQEKGESE